MKKLIVLLAAVLLLSIVLKVEAQSTSQKSIFVKNGNVYEKTITTVISTSISPKELRVAENVLDHEAQEFLNQNDSTLKLNIVEKDSLIFKEGLFQIKEISKFDSLFMKGSFLAKETIGNSKESKAHSLKFLSGALYLTILLYILAIIFYFIKRKGFKDNLKEKAFKQIKKIFNVFFWVFMTSIFTFLITFLLTNDLFLSFGITCCAAFIAAFIVAIIEAIMEAFIIAFIIAFIAVIIGSFIETFIGSIIMAFFAAFIGAWIATLIGIMIILKNKKSYLKEKN